MAAKNDETNRRNRPQRIAGRAHWLRWGPIFNDPTIVSVLAAPRSFRELECLEWQLTDEELAN
jgi:hypothetical protein